MLRIQVEQGGPILLRKAGKEPKEKSNHSGGKVC